MKASSKIRRTNDVDYISLSRNLRQIRRAVFKKFKYKIFDIWKLTNLDLNIELPNLIDFRSPGF